MIEVNKVYHKDWMQNELPDKSVQLIIADPPYFEVKGDFDFVWKTFADYLADVEIWAVECKRLLADNGTIYWYGDAKNIAYTQITFDRHFNLLNNIVWENTNDHKQQIRFSEGLRTFAPLTERILCYSNLPDPSPFAEMINIRMKELNLKEMDFRKLRPSKNGIPTGWMSNIMLGKNMPKKEDWELIETLIQSGVGYETLMDEYENKRRPFNNERHYGDVIRIPNYETGDYAHDTVKPEKLTRELIMCSSRKNDLVLIPFAGSGTEVAMSVKEGRRAIGFEITERHVEMSNRRVQEIIRKPELFG